MRSHHGTVFALCAHGDCLYSSGDDGLIKVWSLTSKARAALLAAVVRQVTKQVFGYALQRGFALR